MNRPALSAAAVPEGSARHLSLWNTEGFYDLNSAAAGHRVQIDHLTDKGRLVGSFVGAHVEGRWISGFSAPFGGVDFVRADEIPQHVVELVRTVLEQAADAAVEHVDIRMKPPHHGPAESHLLFVLLTVGATVELANVNFFLDLTAPDGGPQPRAKKAARRAVDLGWEVAELDLDDEPGWAAAYAVLERNRVDKGRPMRLSLEYVLALRDRFRPLIRMYVVRAPGDVLAAALLYRTAAGHDVVQYWGDQPSAALPLSPMPLLADAVFSAARRAGATFVDLGISTDDARPNHGLIQFKRSVGATSEVRLEVSIEVASALASPRWERLRG